MRHTIHLWTVAVATLFACCLCHGGEPKKVYPTTAAADAVEAACKKAAAESKLIFLKSGFPECGYCVIFDRFHRRPEVVRILEPHYVIVAIDTNYMPDGKAVFSKFAPPSAPSWVIITPDRKVVIDSFVSKGDDDSNVGYPLQPDETAYYLSALKKASPSIADEDLRILGEQIKKAAGR